MRGRVVMPWALVVAAGIACGTTDAPASAEPPTAAGDRPAAILLVLIDELGRDAFAGGAMPNLDRLAAGGAHLRDVVATADRFEPALASLLTGRWMSEHRVGIDRESPAESFRGIESAFVEAGYELAAGATCDARESLARVAPRTDPIAIPPSGQQGLRDFTQSVVDRSGSMFTLLVMRPRCDPAAAPSGDAGAFYAELDDRLGKVLRRMDVFAREDLLMAVIGLRGNGVAGDLAMGRLATGATFYWPARIPPQVRIQRTVSATDLLPTIASLAGLQVESSGQSLVPLLAPGPTAVTLRGYRRRPAFAESWEAPPESRRAATAVVLDGWRMVRTEGGENEPADRLYDHYSDPLGREELSARHPNVVRRLGLRLDRWAASLPGS